MMQENESRFTLKHQAIFYGLMSFVAFTTATVGFLTLNNLTVFSGGVLAFTVVWPLTIATGAAHLLKESFSLDNQLEGVTGEEGELDLQEAMEDVAGMFEEAEEEEAVEDAK